MFTHTHGLLAYGLARKADRRSRWLAVIGAALPDIGIVLGVPVLLFAARYLGYDFEERFDSSWLFYLTALLHSGVAWACAALFILPLWERGRWFILGAFSHLVTDFLTHNGRWTYNHLWPLEVAPWPSPISYWDPWFIALDTLVWAVTLSVIIIRWRRRRLMPSRLRASRSGGRASSAPGPGAPPRPPQPGRKTRS